MSFQTYLDTIEKKTGLTPPQLLDKATERGCDLGRKAGANLAWLKEDYDLSCGHDMALVHMIT